MKNELWSKGYSFIEQDLELYKLFYLKTVFA